MTRAEVARDAAAASEAAREREKRLLKSAEKVAEDDHAERMDLERRLAGADAAVARLRAAIAAADGRVDTTIAAARADAAAARSLLAACADEHRRLATDADRVRTSLLSLQAYVRDVCLR